MNTIQGDIEESWIRGLHFDTIFLMDVIEHFRNPSKALLNIRKMLMDNGHLIINTPNIINIRKLCLYLIKPKKMLDLTSSGKCSGLHLQEYDYSMLEQLLNFCGFKIERIIPTSIWSNIFPKLGNNLLVFCKKTEPINVYNCIKTRYQNVNQKQKLKGKIEE